MLVRAKLRRFCLVLVPLVVIALAGGASASNKYLEIPPEKEAEASRAYRYANLTNDQAYAELDRRRVPYTQTKAPLPGVQAPIRFTGKVRGIDLHSVLPPDDRKSSYFEILDARLALALDDFLKVLAQHDVVEVVHYTMYRPPTSNPSDPKKPQTRHPGGMAVDIGALRKKNGLWLVVGSHWPAAIGARTCGAGMRKIKNRRGRELRSILCEAADQRIFHYMLTPHFDAAHHDHWHLEVKPAVKWFLVN